MRETNLIRRAACRPVASLPGEVAASSLSTASQAAPVAWDLFRWQAEKSWKDAGRRVHTRRGIETYAKRLATVQVRCRALLEMEVGR